MIITESKAMSIISNEEIAGKISQLSGIYEQYRKIERDLKQKNGCSSCSLSEPEFGVLRPKAVAAIRNLPSEAKEKLKTHLVTPKLDFYETPAGGGSPKKVSF